MSVKYFGVYLSHNMKWYCHIDCIANKALKVLGLIKHLLSNASEKVRLIAYVTLCRPFIEYVCEIWNPTTQTLITKLENIQSKAMRFVKNLKRTYVSGSSARVLIGLDARTIKETKELHFFTLFWSMSLSFLTC